MKKLITLTLLLAIGPASAATIDFESQTVDGWFTNGSGAIVDNGFTVYRDGNDQYGVGSWAGDNMVNFCTDCSEKPLIIEHTAGNTFDLVSLDFAETYVPLIADGLVRDFTFTGYLAGGGTVQTSIYNIALINPNGDGELSTILFDGGWSGLSSVEISWESTEPFSAAVIDNIVVSNVVPIPAAVWLFGSALLGMGWLRRPKLV